MTKTEKQTFKELDTQFLVLDALLLRTYREQNLEQKEAHFEVAWNQYLRLRKRWMDLTETEL